MTKTEQTEQILFQVTEQQVIISIFHKNDNGKIILTDISSTKLSTTKKDIRTTIITSMCFLLEKAMTHIEHLLDSIAIIYSSNFSKEEKEDINKNFFEYIKIRKMSLYNINRRFYD